MSTVTQLRPTINFIPEDLQGDFIYSSFCQLLDAARTRPQVNIVQPLDSLVRQLITGNYADENAVLAYYNMFVRPSVGTRSALIYAIKILNLDATLGEWFDLDFNLPPYQFSLDLASYPEQLNIDNLIDLMNSLRSERSRLSVIRQPDDFQDILFLDDSRLDDALLDNTSGYLYRDVNIWLIQKHSQVIDLSNGVTVNSMITETFSDYIVESSGDWQLDNFNLDTAPYYTPVTSNIDLYTDAYIDLSNVTECNSYYTTQGADFFTLNESALDDIAFFGYTVTSFESDVGVPVRGYLDQDLVLDGLILRDVDVYYQFGVTETQSLDFTPQAWSSFTEDSSGYVALPTPVVGTSRSDYITTNSPLLRYGIGPQFGTAYEYKMSIRQNYTQE